jgi:hypothetical protein
MPSPPRASRGSRFSTTFVIGTTAAPWFAAALVTGARETVIMSLGWLAILLLGLAANVRR